MIMQIRLDQPFTLPRSLKDITRKNLKTLYPYFHKHIIDPDKKVHNNLNVNCIKMDVRLQELVSQMDSLLNNLPFEVFIIVHNKDIEKVKASGLKTPAKSIFKSKTLARLKAAKMTPEKLSIAEKLLEEYNEPYEMDFMAPFDESAITTEKYRLWNSTTISNIFNDALPEAVTILNKADKAYLIRCAVRYKHFSDNDKHAFIIEVLKHFMYEIISGYDYPIRISSTTSHGIKAPHIYEITEISI